MKKVLVAIVVLSMFSSNTSAQNFSPPSGSALPNGIIGQAYSGQVLSFTVPATADINTVILGDPLVIPGVPIPIPNPNLDLAADVTDVTWAVEGLPAGLTAVCDASPCTYIANASGTITISGTPAEAGAFTINITSLTNGSVTLPAPISQTIALENQPEVLDELGYTLLISSSGPCVPPNVLFAGLNASYTVSDNPVTLTGAPSGGTFFGEGIDGSQFDPAVAGVGSHAITYAFVDNQNCIGAYSICTSVELTVGDNPNNIGGNGNQLTISPNPSYGWFSISIRDVSGIIRCSVFDQLGKEVYNDSFYSNGQFDSSINLEQFSAGIYTVRVNTSSAVMIEKLIISK